MSTESVMLLSAGIAAGSSLLTLLITRLFDAKSEKRKEREHLFFELFPRRLELYEDIIKAIESIPNKDKLELKGSPLELINDFNELKSKLTELSMRCNVYGGQKVLTAIYALFKTLLLFIRIVSDKPDGSWRDFDSSFTALMMDKISITEIIREESGAYIMDNKFANLL